MKYNKLHSFSDQLTRMSTEHCKKNLQCLYQKCCMSRWLNWKACTQIALFVMCMLLVTVLGYTESYAITYDHGNEDFNLKLSSDEWEATYKDNGSIDWFIRNGKEWLIVTTEDNQHWDTKQEFYEYLIHEFDTYKQFKVEQINVLSSDSILIQV